MDEEKGFKPKREWVADVTRQAAYSYINILKRENPQLEYFISEPLNDKRLGYVGVYSRIREDSC